MSPVIGYHSHYDSGYSRRGRRNGLDPEWVADQARAVLEDMPVNVFKIGMLGSVEIIASIAEVILDYPNIPLVLDPVLASAR